MKKVFYWVSTTLQALFLIVAFGIQWFSMKKMGMRRYIAYINREWEAQYPVEAIRYMAIVFLIILAIAAILYAIIRKGSCFTDKKALSILLSEVIITFAFVFFTLSYSTDSYRSYYFTSLILGIVALIQDIKVIVYLKRN